jgi:hypothetical protein
MSTKRRRMTRKNTSMEDLIGRYGEIREGEGPILHGKYERMIAIGVASREVIRHCVNKLKKQGLPFKPGDFDTQSALRDGVEDVLEALEEPPMSDYEIEMLNRVEFKVINVLMNLVKEEKEMK